MINCIYYVLLFQELIEEYERVHAGDAVSTASGSASDKKKVPDSGKRKAEDKGKNEKSAKKPDTRFVSVIEYWQISWIYFQAERICQRVDSREDYWSNKRPWRAVLPHQGLQ